MSLYISEEYLFSYTHIWYVHSISLNNVYHFWKYDFYLKQSVVNLRNIKLIDLVYIIKNEVYCILLYVEIQNSEKLWKSNHHYFGWIAI